MAHSFVDFDFAPSELARISRDNTAVVRNSGMRFQLRAFEDPEFLDERMKQSILESDVPPGQGHENWVFIPSKSGTFILDRRITTTCNRTRDTQVRG